MTELLDRALAVARTLPPDAQDDIARIVLAFSGDDEAVVLSEDEKAPVERSKQAAAAGDFATDDEVERLWRRHGL
ncbi:hypothetical protein A33M_2588 [Rhodovulum sp. PH10]|uniref:hypothetical protein n=1 Tax=Rhodovulum sp. PH10 TaxID=1187851 RepID=UPI00027C2011|nr:hypothetical protein [Rhodovulum sp. PH10]EJW11940.1 hypothetical protein A33M_2588 [Rhodovulum sp. PH10]